MVLWPFDLDYGLMESVEQSILELPLALLPFLMNLTLLPELECLDYPFAYILNSAISYYPRCRATMN